MKLGFETDDFCWSVRFAIFDEKRNLNSYKCWTKIQKASYHFSKADYLLWENMPDSWQMQQRKGG